MNTENQYYICQPYGNIFVELEKNKIPSPEYKCSMEQLEPGITDGAVEKHVPFTNLHGTKLQVKIGILPHPMTVEHYIQWISVVTDRGHQWKYLTPGEAPETIFLVPDNETILAVYAYCNLHKLWVKRFDKR